MLLIKWLTFPVINFLIIFSSLFLPVPSVAKQPQWINLGTENELIYKINPKMQRSNDNSSIVVYELLVIPPVHLSQQTGIRFSFIQLIARCSSRSQALSQIENFNHQGLSMGIIDHDITDPLEWETPKQDIYGKAFNYACSSR